MQEAAASTRQFEQTRKLEESYKRRIVELLEPACWGRDACARPSRQTWTTLSRKKLARTMIRKRPRCAASKPATKCARTATDPKGYLPGALSNNLPARRARLRFPAPQLPATQ